MVKFSFLLGAKFVKRDSTSYCAILNIIRLGFALKRFHIKISRNGDNVNLVVVIALNAVVGNKPLHKK